MLPSAALIPPWAATVCDRVGNSLVMHLQPDQHDNMGSSQPTWQPPPKGPWAAAPADIDHLPRPKPRCYSGLF